jgi:hypothetical protein
MDLSQILISVISFSIIAGGFYFSTKQRLDKIERDLYVHNKINTEIVDRLARIETKLDFFTKN